MSNEPSLPVLKYVLSEVAEAHLEEGYQWWIELPVGGLADAERWMKTVLDFLEEEADFLSRVDFRREIAPESWPQRLRYAVICRTGKRKQGSPWRILYEIIDDNDDGVRDTLRVISIKHAAGER